MSRVVTDETTFERESGDGANARSSARSRSRSGVPSRSRMRAVRARLVVAVTFASVMAVFLFGDEGESGRTFLRGFSPGLSP